MRFKTYDTQTPHIMVLLFPFTSIVVFGVWVILAMISHKKKWKSDEVKLALTLYFYDNVGLYIAINNTWY